MPAAIRFLAINLVDRDAVVLSATSAVLPVTNIRHHHKKKVWRSSGVSSERINIDLVDTNLTVKGFALTGHNLTRDGTIELLHSTDNITFTSLGIINVDPDTKAGYGEGTYGQGGYGGFSLSNEDGPVIPDTHWLFFSGLTSRYWRILIKDAANSDNFLTVGRVFLGNYLEPAAQITRGWNVEVVDETQTKKSIGGQKWRTIRTPFLRVSFQLARLTENEGIRDLLNTIFRRFAMQNDLFLILFPDGSNQIKNATGIYGSFVSGLGVSNPAIGVYASDQIDFEESL